MFRFICAEAMFIGVGMSLNLATQEVVFNRIQIRASLKKMEAGLVVYTTDAFTLTCPCVLPVFV